MADTFHTIAAPSEGIYREKMSRFLAFAVPISSVEEAKATVKRFQNEYHDARHVCWAYMLGADRATFMSNDNGEPSGTAGRPILGQINSFGLTNVMIVVVRYFGGIKLGTSGLIVAYKEAAAEALCAASIIECHEQSVIEFSFPYVSMNSVMRAVKSPDIKILEQEFDNSCRMRVSIRSDYAAALKARLADVDGLTFA